MSGTDKHAPGASSGSTATARPASRRCAPPSSIRLVFECAGRHTAEIARARPATYPTVCPPVSAPGPTRPCGLESSDRHHRLHRQHWASSVGRRASSIGRRASSVGRRASGVGRRASSVGRQASGVEHRASGVGRRASGVGRRASSIGRLASSIGRRASGVGRLASGVGRRASGVERRASGVWRRASGVGRQASGVGRRASGICPSSPSNRLAALSFQTTKPTASRARILHILHSWHPQTSLRPPYRARWIQDLRAPRGHHRSSPHLPTGPHESCRNRHLRAGRKLRQKISLPARGGVHRWHRCTPRGLLHIHHSLVLSTQDRGLQVRLHELRQQVHHSTCCPRRPLSPNSRPPERPREACSIPPLPQEKEDKVGGVRRTPLPSSTSSTVVWQAAAPPESARGHCQPNSRP